MIKTAICDDNIQDRDRLKIALAKIPSEISQSNFNITEFCCGEDLLNFYSKNDAKFDLIFIDMIMDKINGLQTAAQIRKIDSKVKIVFVTYSSEYAVDSYDVNAFGYLLKPINQQKLNKLLKKIIKSMKQESCYTYHTGNLVGKCRYSDIVFIESNNHNVIIHLTSGNKLEFRGRLSDVEKELNNQAFLRCHQSYLVNMSHIIHSSDTFEMDNGDKVLIRSRDKKSIIERYYDWLFEDEEKW